MQLEKHSPAHSSELNGLSDKISDKLICVGHYAPINWLMVLLKGLYCTKYLEGPMGITSNTKKVIFVGHYAPINWTMVVHKNTQIQM